MLFRQKSGPMLLIAWIGDFDLGRLLITCSSLLRRLCSTFSHDCSKQDRVIQNNPKYSKKNKQKKMAATKQIYLQLKSSTTDPRRGALKGLYGKCVIIMYLINLNCSNFTEIIQINYLINYLLIYTCIYWKYLFIECIVEFIFIIILYY